MNVAVGNAQSKVNMLRLTYTLRLCAVVVSFPVIVLVIACATLLHPITSFKTKFHTSLRLWMSVMDWIEGIPIGYTDWVEYHVSLPTLDEYRGAPRRIDCQALILRGCFHSNA